MSLFFYNKSYKIPKSVVIKLLGGYYSLYYKIVYYHFIWIFGIFGYIKKRFPTIISLSLKTNWLFIQSNKKSKVLSVYKILNNIIFGLSKGFSYSIKIIGVGYKFKYTLNKNWMLVKLGFSHFFRIKLSLSEFKILLLKKNVLAFFGFDKQLLTNLIFFIKSFRKLDSYKIKGIMFFNEIPILKPGKKEQV